jgi:hypothetical protein
MNNMEDTSIIVCEIIFYDIASGKEKSIVGIVNRAELKDFSKNMNGFICPIDTDYIINKHDITKIITHRKLKEFTKRRGENILFPRVDRDFGTVAF